jgi:sigma-E factor negative regulatory protein RseB
MSRPPVRNAPLLGLALTCSLAGSAFAEEPAPPSAGAQSPALTHQTPHEHAPAQWLQRMNDALTTRNYDGTFSHWHGGRVEMLRIIHRVQNGVVSERLVSLDGSGREFIRTGQSLVCYLPDRRTVLVEQHIAQQPLVGLHFPAVNDQTASFYDIREIGHTRVNRRDTHIIEVVPKDEYRYGYRLWIDGSTSMPIKSQLCDAHGNVIEQVVFASLALAAHIPDSAFKPEVSTEGFQWLRSDAPQAGPAPANALAWNAMRLPPGFRMMVRSAQTLPGSANPVDHMVFTDGFASVSVFIEVQGVRAGQPSVPQSATVGSSSAFSTVVDGHKITAVGEVPPATVQFIATQVQAQGPVAVGTPTR